METALPLLQRWLLFAGVLLLTGAATWRVIIAPRAARMVEPEGGTSSDKAADTSRTINELTGRVTGLAAITAVVLVHVWLLRLVVQLMGFRDPFAPLRDDLELLIGGTTWGTVWMLQGLVLLWLATGFLLLAARRRPMLGQDGTRPLPAPWYGVVVGVLLLVLTLALSSHAMSMAGRGILVAADALHTLAAGTWLGSLAVILAARPRNVDRAAFARLQAAQLRAFSPVAMVSVAMLVSMGVWLSWQHLGGVQNLWQSRYGQVLAGKLLVVAVVLLLGLLNWRRGLPTMDGDDGVRSVRRRAAFELAAAAVVLGLTAVLTGTSMPGEGG